jgi:small GTP-binding protein
MADDDDAVEIKTILVGMSGTGKTNIINAITGQKFEENKFTTSTSSFVDKYMTVKNKKYRLEIWDTAGQEKFRSLTKIFIKDSKIVIFVYDITTRASFEEIDFWVETVKDILKEDKIVYGLAGNKKDLFQNEAVEEEEGEKKAQEIGALFKLTSAKTGQGINEFIQSLLEEYVKKIGDSPNDNNNAKGNKLSGNNSNGEKKKSKCC